MANDVKWFKFMNGMFDDEKIEYIESLPDGESILMIWIKILCLASKSNSDGFLMITKEIPYTSDLLAHKFKKTPVQIEYALGIMQKLEMLDIVDNIICVSNWTKYQSVDELARIREQTRLRVAKCRENKKLIECSATSNATVTQNCNDFALIYNSSSSSNNSKSNDYKEIVDYLNNKINASYKYTTKKTQQLISARKKEGFGVDDFKKVIDNMFNKWNGTEYEQYLRPETLFGTKFEGYLNQQPTRQTQTQPVKKYGDGSAYEFTD